MVNRYSSDVAPHNPRHNLTWDGPLVLAPPFPKYNVDDCIAGRFRYVLNRTQHCIWGEGAGQRYKTIPGRLKLSMVEGGLCLRRRVGKKNIPGALPHTERTGAQDPEADTVSNRLGDEGERPRDRDTLICLCLAQDFWALSRFSYAACLQLMKGSSFSRLSPLAKGRIVAPSVFAGVALSPFLSKARSHSASQPALQGL